MTWMKFGYLAVVCTFLVVAGVSGGHQAHRQEGSSALEESESDPALQTAEPAAEGIAATTESASTHQSHLAADIPSELKPFSVPDWLGRLHPMAIHFPIALFLAAFVAELLFIATGEDLFRHALRFSLWGGAMSAALAAPLGWMFAASGATEAGWLLEAHRWAGTSGAILGIAVLLIGEHAERTQGSRTLLRVFLALQALLIGGAGFLGGSLLYGIDHLWRGL